MVYCSLPNFLLIDASCHLCKSKNCKFVQILKFCDLPQQPLHRSLACDSEPMVHSSTSNFTWIGASRHACRAWYIKFNQFGNIWGSHTHQPSHNGVNLAHNSEHVVCSSTPHFTVMISASCHPCRQETPNLTKFWIIFGCSYIHLFTIGTKFGVWDVWCSWLVHALPLQVKNSWKIATYTRHCSQIWHTEVKPEVCISMTNFSYHCQPCKTKNHWKKTKMWPNFESWARLLYMYALHSQVRAKFGMRELSHGTLITPDFTLSGRGPNGQKTQIWPYFQIQHPVMTPPSNAEKKLNAGAQTKTTLNRFWKLKCSMMTCVHKLYHSKAWWTETSNFFIPRLCASPSSTIPTMVTEEVCTISATP